MMKRAICIPAERYEAMIKSYDDVVEELRMLKETRVEVKQDNCSNLALKAKTESILLINEINNFFVLDLICRFVKNVIKE